MSAKVPGADLRRLRDRLDIDDAFGWRPQILALLNHIDAIETERSAAPDLLSALKQTLIPLMAYRGMGWVDRGDVLPTVQAAIAKAEGQQ